MTVQSIKEDIQNAYPPKIETKKLGLDAFIMNSYYGQIFSSLFEMYNLDEFFENYKKEISEENS